MRLRRRSVHGKYVSKPRTHSTPHSVEKNGQYGAAIKLPCYSSSVARGWKSKYTRFNLSMLICV